MRTVSLAMVAVRDATVALISASDCVSFASNSVTVRCDANDRGAWAQRRMRSAIVNFSGAPVVHQANPYATKYAVGI